MKIFAYAGAQILSMTHPIIFQLLMKVKAQ